MDNTGRLGTPLHPTARGLTIVPPTTTPEDEIRAMLTVERAHVVMLAEQRLISPATASAILAAVRHLFDERFEPLRGQPSTRGVYLAYEDWLIQRLGAGVGGMAHLGRSRNDLGASVLRLRLRHPVRHVAAGLLRLAELLVGLVERRAAVTMPAYTHFQAAVPITLGHYCAAVAFGVLRDLEGWLDASADLQRLPLGAAAGGGTTFPLDTRRTAELLGFGRPAENSLDAVASRDMVLRLLSAAAIAGVTLSRVAADLLLWTTAEYGLMLLPDEVAGSSSNMPQKRNPFLLEHVQGRSAGAVGALMTSLQAMHGKPYSNSVAVNGDAVRPIWSALDDIAAAATLLRLVLARAQPRSSVMSARAVEGYTTAAATAERIAASGAMSFREAHRAIGRILTEEANAGGGQGDAIGSFLSSLGLGHLRKTIEPGATVAAASYGGGPAPESIETQRSIIVARISAARRRVHSMRAVWRNGADLLADAEAAVMAKGPCSVDSQERGAS